MANNSPGQGPLEQRKPPEQGSLERKKEDFKKEWWASITAPPPRLTHSEDQFDTCQALESVIINNACILYKTDVVIVTQCHIEQLNGGRKPYGYGQFKVALANKKATVGLNLLTPWTHDHETRYRALEELWHHINTAIKEVIPAPRWLA
ncbi:MAG: hypothetical protein M1820_007075 [Bogoriella megaspora]|nr:MAG: hypothetical protein M1820_007075 [Bogoriella megaspora]